MTTYTVTQDSQPLFPDGKNRAMSLINRGPWTIFVDSESSIGPHSYQLKPAETLVWPEATPLWVKGNSVDADTMFGRMTDNGFWKYGSEYQASTLIATPIINASNSQNDAGIILPIRDSRMPFSDGLVSDYPFECGSFSSIIFTIRSIGFQRDGEPNDNQAYAVDLYWFDDNLNKVSVERFNLFHQTVDTSNPSADVVHPQRIVTDVKARYCFPFVFDPTGLKQFDSTIQWHWEIQGSTKRVAPNLYHWATQYDGPSPGTFNSAPIYRGLAAAPNNADNNSISFGSDWAYIKEWEQFMVGNPRIFLNNPYRTLTISVRTVLVTTAFQIHIESAPVKSVTSVLGRLLIGTGTTVVTETFKVPLTQPLYLLKTVNEPGGQIAISMIWSDS